MYKGFFEAPQDGEYLFHITCDSECEFLLSTTVGREDDPAALETLMTSDESRPFRRFDPLFN